MNSILWIVIVLFHTINLHHEHLLLHLHHSELLLLHHYCLLQVIWINICLLGHWHRHTLRHWHSLSHGHSLGHRHSLSHRHALWHWHSLLVWPRLMLLWLSPALPLVVILTLHDLVCKVLDHHWVGLQQGVIRLLLLRLWSHCVLFEHLLMLVLTEILLVHEVFHHLLLLVLALIKLHEQLLTVYLLVVQAV